MPATLPSLWRQLATSDKVQGSVEEIQPYITFPQTGYATPSEARIVCHHGLSLCLISRWSKSRGMAVEPTCRDRRCLHPSGGRLCIVSPIFILVTGESLRHSHQSELAGCFHGRSGLHATRAPAQLAAPTSSSASSDNDPSSSSDASPTPNASRSSSVFFRYA